MRCVRRTFLVRQVTILLVLKQLLDQPLGERSGNLEAEPCVVSSHIYHDLHERSLG